MIYAMWDGNLFINMLVIENLEGWMVLDMGFVLNGG
jgi:hypothetical protein